MSWMSLIAYNASTSCSTTQITPESFPPMATIITLHSHCLHLPTIKTSADINRPFSSILSVQRFSVQNRYRSTIHVQLTWIGRMPTTKVLVGNSSVWMSETIIPWLPWCTMWLTCPFVIRYNRLSADVSTTICGWRSPVALMSMRTGRVDGILSPTSSVVAFSSMIAMRRWSCRCRSMLNVIVSLNCSLKS